MKLQHYEVDYSTCSDDDFDSILKTLVERDATQLLTVPGVYEAVSEYYNNEVLEIWEQKQRKE